MEAATTTVWLNIGSALSDCVNFVGILANGKVVEAKVNLCVRVEIRQQDVEVGRIGTIGGVVSFGVVAEIEEQLIAWSVFLRIYDYDDVEAEKY